MLWKGAIEVLIYGEGIELDFGFEIGFCYDSGDLRSKQSCPLLEQPWMRDRWWWLKSKWRRRCCRRPLTFEIVMKPTCRSSVGE